MKKLVLGLCLLLLSGCVLVGDFPENRERLHEYGHDEDYCHKNPGRCYNGIPW